MSALEKEARGEQACEHCGDTGIEPGTVVISAGLGFGFNSLDPDPLNRGSYVPCSVCHDQHGNGARGGGSTTTA